MGKQQRGYSAGDLKTAWPPYVIKRVSEGSFIVILTLAFFVLLSLTTYQSTDPGWFHAPAMKYATAEISNAGGQVGAFLADALYWLFGYFAYLLPVSVAYLAWVMLHDHRALHTVDKPMFVLRTAGLLLLLLGGCGQLTILVMGKVSAIYGSGGLLGQLVATRLYYVVNLDGTLLLLLAIVLVGVTWLTGLSWIHVTERVGCYTLLLLH